MPAHSILSCCVDGTRSRQRDCINFRRQETVQCQPHTTHSRRTAAAPINRYSLTSHTQQPTHPPPCPTLFPSLQSALSHATCSSYFVDPDSLSIGAFTDNEGKLNCPHCRQKLGSFTWSGEQCSCGRWVTPAFMFNKSKVDEKRPGMTTDGQKAGVVRAPVIVFRPQLDDSSSSGDNGSGRGSSGVGVDEQRQMDVGDTDSKQQSVTSLPQPA